MKRMALVAALALIGWTVSAVVAQEAASRPGRGGPRGMRGGMMMPMGITADILAKLDLTADQKAKIDPMVAARDKELKPIQEKMAEFQKKMTAAREAQDQDQMGSLREEGMALRQEMQTANEKYDKDIMAVLTPDQKAKCYQEMVMMRINMEYAPAKLTKEQTDKINAAFKDQTKGADVTTPAGRMEAGTKLSAWISSDVLTADQKSEMQKAAASRPTRRGGNPPAGN